MHITSSVKNYGGVPTLFINNEPYPAIAYITYLTERNCYEDFAKSQYRLFSITSYFGRQTINEVTDITPFANGIFDNPEKADFSVFDSEVQRILKVCPDAYIFPRLNVNLPVWWEKENPDECNDEGFGGKRPRACFSSQKWREDIKQCLEQLICHIENSTYRDNIIGYQLGGGNTEEWFSFDQKGSIGKRAREKFAQYPLERQNELEFRRFLNNAVAETICELASFVKKLTKNQLIVGSFYGYTLETPFWQSGHHSLKTVLECGDIDFLCSPASYTKGRSAGRDFSCMSVLDSIKLHGKLYFTECDIRTHETKPLGECREGACREGTYCDGLWKGCENKFISQNILKACFARQLTHGNALWWFDMWGGWYKDKEIMRDMQKYCEIMNAALYDRNRQSIAEAAIVTDEDSFLHVDGYNELIINMVDRDAYGQCGVPYDIYDVYDFETVLNRYKVFIFIAPYKTEALDAAIERCDQFHIPYMVVDDSKPDCLVSELREFYAENNVHSYIDTNDVIYVCENYIAVHAAGDGIKTIKLNGIKKVRELFSDESYLNTDVIRVDMEKYETRIFRIDNM